MRWPRVGFSALVWAAGKGTWPLRRRERAVSPLIPLDEMARWLENKPAGFGEGKTYDTTAEELLLEEERRREAQLANINKLKNEAKFGKARVTASRFAAIYVIPSALGVSIWKKNIHRDLPLTFKGFPGLC